MYRLRSVLNESGMNRRAVGLKRNPTCSDTFLRIELSIVSLLSIGQLAEKVCQYSSETCAVTTRNNLNIPQYIIRGFCTTLSN